MYWQNAKNLCDKYKSCVRSLFYQIYFIKNFAKSGLTGLFRLKACYLTREIRPGLQPTVSLVRFNQLSSWGRE